MALPPCMSCLKQCGYLCGALAALNIWFWLGMTIFNAMGNPWIKKEILLMKSYEADTSRYTTVFAICIAVSRPKKTISDIISLMFALLFLHSWTFYAWLGAAGARRRSVIRTRTRWSTIRGIRAEWATLHLRETMICTEWMEVTTRKDCLGRKCQLARNAMRDSLVTNEFGVFKWISNEKALKIAM